MKLENSQKCCFDSSILSKLYSFSFKGCRVPFWLSVPCSNSPSTAASNVFPTVLAHLILQDCELAAIHSKLRYLSSFWFMLSSIGSRQVFRSASRSGSISSHMVCVPILESQVWCRSLLFDDLPPLTWAVQTCFAPFTSPCTPRRASTIFLFVFSPLECVPFSLSKCRGFVLSGAFWLAPCRFWTTSLFLSSFGYTYFCIHCVLLFQLSFLTEEFSETEITSKLQGLVIKFSVLTDTVSASSSRPDLASIVRSKSEGSFITMSVFVFSKAGSYALIYS